MTSPIRDRLLNSPLVPGHIMPPTDATCVTMVPETQYEDFTQESHMNSPVDELHGFVSGTAGLPVTTRSMPAFTSTLGDKGLLKRPESSGDPKAGFKFGHREPVNLNMQRSYGSEVNLQSRKVTPEPTQPSTDGEPLVNLRTTNFTNAFDRLSKELNTLERYSSQSEQRR